MSNKKWPYSLRLPVLLACAAVLSACAQPTSLYNWASYQPSVHHYLKDDGADSTAQVQAMEKNIETARSASHALPPGFHAHLGLLYLKQGDTRHAFSQFEREKNAFPESAPFMDFLMRHQAQSTSGQPDKSGTTLTSRGD